MNPREVFAAVPVDREANISGSGCGNIRRSEVVVLKMLFQEERLDRGWY